MCVLIARTKAPSTQIRPDLSHPMRIRMRPMQEHPPATAYHSASAPNHDLSRRSNCARLRGPLVAPIRFARICIPRARKLLFPCGLIARVHNFFPNVMFFLATQVHLLTSQLARPMKAFKLCEPTIKISLLAPTGQSPNTLVLSSSSSPYLHQSSAPLFLGAFPFFPTSPQQAWKESQ